MVRLWPSLDCWLLTATCFILVKSRPFDDLRGDGVDSETLKVATANTKFLVFHPILSGQGEGNIVSGLLAAHMLGEEFGRIVCVSPEYISFRSAFEAIGLAKDYCHSENLGDNQEEQLSLYNYGKQQQDDCQIIDILNGTSPIVHFRGNTYPSWPTGMSPPDDTYFGKYYRPTAELLEVLPWKLGQPPEIVVHLRQSDGATDARSGLDEQSLRALGEHIANEHGSSQAFLVTNRVEWYAWFSSHFQWQHPLWDGVRHSALDIDWNPSSETMKADELSKDQQKEMQQFQLWSDWYTILNAQVAVYHTFSDFSLSAVRWSMAKSHSYTILGSHANENLSGSTVLDLQRDDSQHFPTEVLPLHRRHPISACRNFKPPLKPFLLRPSTWMVAGGVLFMAILSAFTMFLRSTLDPVPVSVAMKSLVAVEHGQAKKD